MPELVPASDSLRTTCDKRNRLKALEISDLPEELLSRIFEYEQTDSIKQVRLTCRRFSETSSHLLLDYVPVCLTRKSLAHLEEVSRHPFLSKGVRAIKLSLVPFYDAVLANDIHAFAANRASILWDALENWETLQSSVDLRQYAPSNLTGEVIQKAVFLAQSWEKVAAQGIDAADVDHVLLARAHEEYSNCNRDYKDLCSILAQRIASAMKRMPTASWLTTNDSSWGFESQHISTFLPTDLDRPDSLLAKLVAPRGASSLGWRERREEQDAGIDPPPFHLIGDLLLSIQKLGVTLKGFELGTPPPADGVSITHTTQEDTGLHSAVQQLRTIQFHPQINIRSREWLERPADEWKPLIKFLTHLLHTESLQRIDLNFYFMLYDDTQPLLSMAPILLSFAWPNLKILRFNGPFQFEELQSVVKRLDKKVRLQWRGFLMNGSWAKLLDFFERTQV